MSMRGTERTAVRGPFIVAAAAAVVALAVGLLAPVVERTRHTSHQHHALVIAARVELPAAFAPTSRLGGLPCVGGPAGPGDLRCWFVPGTPANTVQALDSALRTAGLIPSKAACHGLPLAQLSPPTKSCLVRAQIQGWVIELIAIPNIVYAKLVRPKPGQPFVPPKAHVVGTEVILSAESG